MTTMMYIIVWNNKSRKLTNQGIFLKPWKLASINKSTLTVNCLLAKKIIYIFVLREILFILNQYVESKVTPLHFWRQSTACRIFALCIVYCDGNTIGIENSRPRYLVGNVKKTWCALCMYCGRKHCVKISNIWPRKKEVRVWKVQNKSFFN